MKTYLVRLSLLLGALCVYPLSGHAAASVPGPQDRLLNDGWRFHRGDVMGAEQPGFADAQWRNVDLPHDWSIEDIPGPQTETQIGPFSKEVPNGFLTGFTVGGTGWYRRHFTLDKSEAGKLVSVLFEGVCNEADVWINGTHLGCHPNGATSFAYDLTPCLNPAGEPNELVVKVNNIGTTGMKPSADEKGPPGFGPAGLGWTTSQWYTGSGIYRNVWLTVSDPVHIPLWGVHVTTPVVKKEKAAINVAISLENRTAQEKEVTVVTTLMGPKGKIAGTTTAIAKIGARDNVSVLQTLDVPRPDLWSPDSPSLYQAKVEVQTGGATVGIYPIKFGIRSLTYDATNGLQINGHTVKLRGGCIHDNNGILGGAEIDRAEERRIELLKANGFNAIRTAHNPPSPALLDACDRLGMLVLDEAFDVWEGKKSARDYHLYFRDWWKRDLTSMVLRDRNHPSVIMWSVGNEIQERADPEGVIIGKYLIERIRQYDTTRPITEAVNPPFDYTTGKTRDWDQASTPVYAMLDIAGYNYNWKNWEEDHQKHPDRLMMTTESTPQDVFAVWSRIEQHPWLLGDFVWTAMDYLGESGIAHGAREGEKVDYGLSFPGLGGFGRNWPWFNAWCGDIDIIGGKKPQSYYRDVVWRRSPMEIAVAVPDPAGRKELVSTWGWRAELPSWTWPGEEGKKLQVNVYTRCTRVRLELNGRVIGEQTITAKAVDAASAAVDSTPAMNAPELTARFEVPYEAGELKAIGYTEGKEVVSKVLRSAGKPKKVLLIPDRSTIKASRSDLSYVTIEVADENGNLVPHAALPVKLTVRGDGELAAAGNGSPDEMASFQRSECRTFRGRALVILRPYARPGTITVKAESEGLEPTVVQINIAEERS